MAENTNANQEVVKRALQWAAVIGIAGSIFALGAGFGLRIRNLDDAPMIHRRHERDIEAIQQWACDQADIPNFRCDGYWEDRR